MWCLIEVVFHVLDISKVCFSSTREDKCFKKCLAGFLPFHYYSGYLGAAAAYLGAAAAYQGAAAAYLGAASAYLGAAAAYMGAAAAYMMDKMRIILNSA